jgi:hypothetical protein
MRAQQGPRIHPALTLLVIALTALSQLLTGAPAGAARAAPRPTPAAPTYTSPAPAGSASAGRENRRSARPAGPATSTGATRRLESSQRALVRASRGMDAGHPGSPATDGTYAASRRLLRLTQACDPLDPAHHRFLPVGAGRSPPDGCGS